MTAPHTDKHNPATTEVGGRHPAQWLALAIGAVYTLVGIAGFFVTGFDNFASETNETLLGFEVNPLHNIVHLVIGVAGLALAQKLSTTRFYGWTLFAGYGLTFLYGLFAVNSEELNFLSINGADNVLHILSALAGLAIALWPAAEHRTGEAYPQGTATGATSRRTTR